MKNWNFSEVEGARFTSQKTGHCCTTRTVFCDVKMAYSTMEKTNSSSCLCIYKCALLFVLLACTSCWRMPEEGEVSTLPNVNSPSLIRKKNADMPTDVGH